MEVAPTACAMLVAGGHGDTQLTGALEDVGHLVQHAVDGHIVRWVDVDEVVDQQLVPRVVSEDGEVPLARGDAVSALFWDLALDDHAVDDMAVHKL